MVPVLYVGKVMFTFFWDCRGVRLTSYFACGRTTKVFSRSYEKKCCAKDAGCGPEVFVCFRTVHRLMQLSAPSPLPSGMGMKSWASHYTHRTWHGEISSSSQSTSWTSFFWWPGLDYRRHGSRPRQKYISQEIRTLVKRWEKCIAVRGEYIERGLSSKMFQDRSTSVKGSVPWWRNGRSASHCGVHT